MRDRSERVCSSYWSSSAQLSGKEKSIRLAIGPGVVEETDPAPFP